MILNKSMFSSWAKICLILLFTFSFTIKAERPLTYFLDDIEYDASIPSPKDFLGYQIGEWHLNHALLAQYIEKVAEASDRAIIYEYARSHEYRPLMHMVITSEENQENLEAIRKNHLALTDPEISGDIDVSDMPSVVFLGYGVHGNEPSAHNAAPLVAYYLAAGKDDKVQEILDNMVIIIDPSLNPDGQDRFASWVNRHRSKNLNPDPNNREFRDVWPGSRTNHYWFDLNRDWLPVQHPESKGRVKAYHNWRPNINTDHHEFGSNNTFFFQPGEPARVNPRTPQRTDDLTFEVAKYHAAAFDEIGQTYYTQEGFDDFYYGKGSTYPDVHGSIGILFEQASSRGHLRETIHGELEFPQTISNQVVVSLSSIEAGLEMRETLLNHLRWFYSSAMEEAEQENTEAYIFGDSKDQGKNKHFLEILNTHEVEFFDITQEISVEDSNFKPGSAWVVPLKQPQYRLVQSMFEKVQTFQDSIFYDVSTWTKPLAFNTPYEEITSSRELENIKGQQVDEISMPQGKVAGEKSNVGYLFTWDDYYAPKALYYLQKNDMRTQVATSPLTMDIEGKTKAFGYGTIFVPVKTQDIDAEEVYELVSKAANHAGIDIHSVETSLVDEGIHLGSPSFSSVDKPKTLMLIGSGTSSREAGEVWHLLDQRFNMPVTKVELERFGGIDIGQYNTIVMVSGSYNRLDESDREELTRWVENGGSIIALRTANQWLNEYEFTDIEFVSTPDEDEEEAEMLPYKKRRDYYGSRRISGSIFQAKIDTTHPIGYGYHREELPVFVSGTLAAEPADSPFANPLIFAENALMSGYAWELYNNLKDHTAGVLVNQKGRGRIISFTDNPNFRGFWFGTNKLFMNALFFNQIMRN